MDSEPIVINETKNWVAIFKPSGWLTHPDGRTQARALSDWFVDKYPEVKDVGEPQGTSSGEKISRHGVVHRLDRETSGVIVFARTVLGYNHLKEVFANHLADKRYRAFVWGNIKEDEFTLRMPIGRARGDFRKKSANSKARGELREAETRVKVLGRLSIGDERIVFLEARPITGRTHQIRAHLAGAHHPIVGDKLYGSGRPNALGFSRVALHAFKIKFPDLDGTICEIEAPYPKDFIQALESNPKLVGG